MDWSDKLVYLHNDFSVLINGNLVDLFHSSRRLRLGDQLSTYLFVIGTESFSLLKNEAASGGSCQVVG